MNIKLLLFALSLVTAQKIVEVTSKITFYDKSTNETKKEIDMANLPQFQKIAVYE